MNDQNLIPINQRDQEEARRIRSMGGKAKARKTRERKTFQELARIMLEAPAPWLDREELEEVGITSPRDWTNAAAIMAAVVRGARDGNPAMIKFLLKLTEEQPPQKVEIVHQQAERNPFEGMSIEEIRKLAGLDT